MRRYMLRENIRRFEAFVAEAPEDSSVPHFLQLITDMRRELALLDAAMLGVQDYPIEFGSLSQRAVARFRDTFELSDRLTMVIDPRAGLHIVDVTRAYAQATLISRSDVAGHDLFDIFPDNPDLRDATGVANLFASIHEAAHSRRTHYMPIQRYDVRDAAGVYIEKYWLPSNTPIFDDDGKLLFVVHHAEDLTASLQEAQARQAKVERESPEDGS